MHIHGNPISHNVANLHPAGAAEKAAATQRAADIRKKLLNAKAPITEDSDSDAVLMVARWSEGDSEDGGPPEHADPQPESSGAGHAASLEDPGDRPVSFWA